MSWHVHFRTVVERNGLLHVAISKSEPYSSTLGRTSKGLPTAWVLAIAWTSDADGDGAAPHAMRFAYDAYGQGKRPRRLRVDASTSLYLNPPTGDHVRTISDISTMPRVGVLTDAAATVAVSQFLLPTRAEKKTLYFFMSRGAWISKTGPSRATEKTVPIALVFQVRPEVMITVPVTLEAHGRLWSAFDLVRLREFLEEMLQSEPAPEPEPPTPAEEEEEGEPTMASVAPVSWMDAPLTPLRDDYDDGYGYFDTHITCM